MSIGSRSRTSRNSDVAVIGRWEKKIWGRTRRLTPLPEGEKQSPSLVYELEMLAGTFCSIHKHQTKVNHFMVVSGTVRVCFWSPIREKVCGILISTGGAFTVSPGVYHQFQVIDPGLMIETYVPNVAGARVETDDIYRATTGGRLTEGRNWAPNTLFAQDGSPLTEYLFL